MKKRFVVLGLLLLCLGGKAQDAYVPSPENLEARKEFQDSKFGIFLHWGLYSMLAQGDDEPEPGPHGIPQVGFCFLSFPFRCG